LILWEPWDIYCQPEYREEYRRLLPQVDFFSPNLAEARRLTGLGEPRQVIRALLEDGAACVALRMGAQGSLVATANGREMRVPPVHVKQVVDPTGAGNAYCGGFLVGLGETGDLLEACRYAAVSASLALEQFGALRPLEGLMEEAQRRLKQYREIT
jgi:sugar/nucleoside kinase (ribokinase family)